MAQLTVATINLRGSADRWQQRRHLLVAELVDRAPELVSLQEISFPIGQGRWLRNQVNMRLSGSSGRPYQLIQKRRRHPVRGYFEGIGILSRLPTVYHEVISLGYDGRLALRANLEVSAHLTIDFVAVHLHHVAYDRQAREEQVLEMCARLSEHRRVPLQIVAGDFNETPDGPAIRSMKQTFRSAYEARHGYEPLATFPTALSGATDGWAGCLDYIFYSPKAGRALSATLFCDKSDPADDTLYASDHVGLVATLEVGQGGTRAIA